MRKPLLLLATLLLLAAAPAPPATAPTTTTRPGVTVPPHNRIKLWDKPPAFVEGADTYTDPNEPTLDCYEAADPASGAAVIIFPGGAYTHLAGRPEGADLAEKLAANHIAAFVLRYRHAPRYHYPVPMLDAQRALRLVRAKADDLHIDPHRLGICGFSAGGHLAATLSTQFDSLPKPDLTDVIDSQNARPDFAMLIYPVINLTDDAIVHKESRRSITNNDEKLYAQLSADQHVTKDTPPTFIVHAAPDKTVPVENSLLYAAALRKNNVPVEMHIFELGKHGFGMAPKDPALHIWPDLAINWMLANKWLTPSPTTTPSPKP